MSLRLGAALGLSSGLCALLGCQGDDEAVSSGLASATVSVAETEGSASTSTTGTSGTTRPSTASIDNTAGSSGGTTGSTSSDSGGSTGLSSTTEGSTTSGGAFCGDGKLGADEECDLGSDKNIDGEYKGCNADCTLGPRCNDGIHQPEDEACDPSDEQLKEVLVCNDVCAWSGVIVFVTAKAHKGGFGGLAGADAICQQEALAAGLLNPQGYRAWLSVDDESAASRVPMSDSAYYRLDGVEIAENSASLLNGTLANPIDVDSFRDPVETTKNVWTNTTPGGAVAVAETDCASFTSSVDDKTPVIGRTDAKGEGWTRVPDNATHTCFDLARIYCFSAELY